MTDNLGAWANVEHTIKVSAPPVAVPAASTTAPNVGETVTFNASGSSDSDGSIVAYAWDLDGNGTYETPGMTGAKAYPNPGAVVVRLKVTDSDGLITETSLTLSVKAVGGGGVVTPTPKPTPTPGPGGGANGGGTPNTPGTPTGRSVSPGRRHDLERRRVDPGAAKALWTNPSAELPGASQIGDFTAGADGRFPSKRPRKAYKGGVAVGFKSTIKCKIAVKAMITTAVAKKAKIATKAKLLSVGSGTLTLAKGGSGKFYVRFNKKYAAKLKRIPKLAVSLRGIANRG